MNLLTARYDTLENFLCTCDIRDELTHMCFLNRKELKRVNSCLSCIEQAYARS